MSTFPSDISINEQLFDFFFKQETKPKVLASRTVRLPYALHIIQLSEVWQNGTVQGTCATKTWMKVLKKWVKTILS